MHQAPRQAGGGLHAVGEALAHVGRTTSRSTTISMLCFLFFSSLISSLRS